MNYAYNEAQMLAGIVEYRKALPPRQRRVVHIPPKLEWHGVRKPVERTPPGPRACSLTAEERGLMQELTDAAAKEFGVEGSLRGCSRKENVLPRFVAMYLIRRETPASLHQVGEHFGNHHTTVCYAAQQIAERAETDEELRVRIDRIVAMATGCT